MIWFDVLATFNLIHIEKKINRMVIFWHKICCDYIDMKIVFLLFSLFIFMMGRPSFADVYRWTDDNGYAHFTDDITQIPEKYRKAVEKIGPEVGEAGGESELSSKKKEEPYKDRLGKNDEYWKTRMEEWRKKLNLLRERMEVLRGKYNELTGKFNDSRSTAERGTLRTEREQVRNEIDQCKIQIEEAKDMLEKKIPEEAELYKAKPEWLKQ